jgi:hypothetical protein
MVYLNIEPSANNPSERSEPNASFVGSSSKKSKEEQSGRIADELGKVLGLTALFLDHLSHPLAKNRIEPVFLEGKRTLAGPIGVLDEKSSSDKVVEVPKIERPTHSNVVLFEDLPNRLDVRVMSFKRFTLIEKEAKGTRVRLPCA